MLPLGNVTLGTYGQAFPISYTELLEAPQVEFMDERGQVQQALTYRQDFVSLLHETPGWGDASGELVWVRDPTYQGLTLGGKIVVRIPSASLDEEVAQAGVDALLASL